MNRGRIRSEWIVGYAEVMK